MRDESFSTNLEYYKVFYFVAKYGSMTTAAEKLCLTQPTVTSAVHRLEEQLGTVLFIRNKRGVRLNREGEILWSRVEPACRLFMTGEQELEDLRSLKGGTLSIASTEMSFRSYVLPVLGKFTEDFPEIKVKFKNDLTENILKMLSAGDVDLAILHAPFAADSQLELRKLGEIEECFVAGAKYKHLAEGRHTLEELQGIPFISVPEGSNTRLFVGELFKEQGLEYEPDIEVTTIDLVIRSAASGLGIAMLPSEQVRELFDDGRLFRIDVECGSMKRNAYTVTSRRFPLSPAAEMFMKRYLGKQ